VVPIVIITVKVKRQVNALRRTVVTAAATVGFAGRINNMTVVGFTGSMRDSAHVIIYIATII
jgi:hypothetical protein